MNLERCATPCIEQPLSGFLQHLGNLLRRIGNTITRWDQLAEQRRQLREMDDRLLADIGLSKADVKRIAGKKFWDDPLRTGELVDERYRYGNRR